MKRALLFLIRLFDPVLALMLLFVAPLLWVSGRLRWRTPVTKNLLDRLGVAVLRHHYYEPIVTDADLHRSLRDIRDLPGLDLRIPQQVALAESFRFTDELLAFPLKKPSETEFGYHNGYYEAGDAEMLYNFVRFFKPRRLVEVGSGQSTLIAREAIQTNKSEDSSYKCDHICMEPFERPWLEQLGVTVIREKIESCSMAVFEALGENDILFIDSSHVLRPQGDITHLFLSVLPRLKAGVHVHVHDVFTPRDYLDQWVNEGRLWNEQYVLEAFLSCNDQFQVMMALNMMACDHREALTSACPILMREPNFQPGAFWFQRIARSGD